MYSNRNTTGESMLFRPLFLHPLLAEITNRERVIESNCSEFMRKADASGMTAEVRVLKRLRHPTGIGFSSHKL
jgi:hypothetical protein